MPFCPWYPLSDAGAHAPAAEGVLQVRIADGLLDYPRGKSAMVHYEHAADVRAAATALARRVGDSGGLLCRHLELEAGERSDAATIYEKVRDEFVRRFGAPPGFPP